MCLSDDKTDKVVPSKKVAGPAHKSEPSKISDKFTYQIEDCSLCGGSGEHEGHSCPCGARRM